MPRLLPVFVSDPELRERAALTFESEDFKNNIEEYFVQNIKVSQGEEILGGGREGGREGGMGEEGKDMAKEKALKRRSNA